MECQKCGLRYYSPRAIYSSIKPDGYGTEAACKNQAEKYYENASFTPRATPDAKKGQRAWLKRYNYDLLNRAFKLNGKPESIYEAGCAVGFMLEDARELGVKEFYGCDINKYAIEIAKARLGFDNVKHGFFCDMPGESADMGIMHNYIEHTNTPFDDLIKINGMLKPGGTLIIKTFMDELDIDGSMVGPTGHRYHFTSKAFKNIIGAAGFRIIDFKVRNIMGTVIGRKFEEKATI